MHVRSVFLLHLHSLAQQVSTLYLYSACTQTFFSLNLLNLFLGQVITINLFELYSIAPIYNKPTFA